MATHSRVLAWRIPGTGEPGGLPSMGSHRVGQDWSDLAAAVCLCHSIISIIQNLYWFIKHRFTTVWVTKLYLGYAAAAKSLQSCPTLSDPIDGSLPGFPVPEILQARTLGWVAISFSNAWKWKVKVKSLCRVRLVATPWTAAYQPPPYWDFPGKSTGVGCHRLLICLHCKMITTIKAINISITSERMLKIYYINKL